MKNIYKKSLRDAGKILANPNSNNMKIQFALDIIETVKRKQQVTHLGRKNF